MNRLEFVCKVLHATVALCVLSQILIEPSYENIWSVVMSGAGIAALTQYLWKSRPFDDAPLSSLALLGFCVTSQLAALVAQTMQWSPYVHMLRDPLTTFSVLSGVQLIGIGTHYVYRHFQPLYGFRDKVASVVLSPWGVHDAPRPLALWVMSLIGVASMAKGGAEMGDVSGKALQALEFMTWMPFLILVYQRQFGEAYCSFKKQAPLVLLYALVIVGIAMARNARQLMFIGPVIATLLYLTVAVRDPGPMPRKSIYKVGVGLILASVAVALVADLATAMVLAREKRETATRWEMLEETYHALTDRTRIQAYRDSGYLAAITEAYDETYLSNPVLARLSETKFHDNMLYFGTRFGELERGDIMEQAGMRIVVLMPQPLIDFLEIKIKKEKYLYSMGDVYVNTDHGGDMGGFVTGSIWADLLVMFGPFAPFVAAMFMVLTFIMLDSLTRLSGSYFISPVGLCMAWIIFIYGIGGESIATKLSMLLRDTPQKVVLYALVFWGVRLFIRQSVHQPQAMKAA